MTPLAQRLAPSVFCLARGTQLAGRGHRLIERRRGHKSAFGVPILYTPGGPYTISGTSLAHYVFDTADWDNSRWIVPLGASDHPGREHYADQVPIWAQVDLIPMTYTWAAIQAGAESHQHLRPK